MYDDNRRLIRTGGFIVVTLLALLFVGINACQSKHKSRETVPNRDINAVMESHVDDLMAIPGVVGVAVGELEDKTPCILVLISEETDKIRQDVPQELEGHPVRLMVSGEIRPMQHD